MSATVPVSQSPRQSLLTWGGYTILVLGFAWLFGAARQAPDMLMWDEAEYADIGRSVLQGQGFSISGVPNSLRPPLWPLSIAARLALSGDASDASLKWATTFYVLLTIVVIAVITARVFDHLTGWICGICLGLMPELWIHAGSLLSEPAFLACFTAAVGFLYLGLHDDPKFLAASAIGAALALLTRYTALLFGPLALGFVVWAGTQSASRTRLMSRWTPSGVLAGVLLLAPWFVRQQLTFGDALIGIKRSSQQLLVYAPNLSMPWNFYLNALPEMLSWPILVAAAGGVLWGLVRRDRFVCHVVVVIAGLLIWFSAYRYKETRLIAVVLPFLAIIAGVGIAQPLTHPRLRTWRLPLALLAVLAIGWRNVPLARHAVEEQVTPGFPIFTKALQELITRCPPDGLILAANVPVTAWYTDRHVERLPTEVSDLAQQAARADWIVITNFEAGQPAYAASLAKQMPGLRPPATDFIFLHDNRWGVALIRAPYVVQHLPPG